MKTFQQFCEDISLREQWWSPFSYTPNIPAPSKPQAPKPPQNVIAYKNYQPGILNKDTNKFTQRPLTPTEKQRYGWEPKTVSSYSTVDTKGKYTKSGLPWNDATRSIAVPYKNPTGGEPLVPMKTKLQLTKAPGQSKVVNASVEDTGDFGRPEGANKEVSYDLSRRIAGEVSNNPNITSNQFGKQMLYVRNQPAPTASVKPTGR